MKIDDTDKKNPMLEIYDVISHRKAYVEKNSILKHLTLRPLFSRPVAILFFKNGSYDMEKNIKMVRISKQDYFKLRNEHWL